MQEKRRGKRTIIIKSESGIEREHLVPHGKRFLVHSGDHVKAGQALVDGPLVPHDILHTTTSLMAAMGIDEFTIGKVRHHAPAGAKKTRG